MTTNKLTVLIVDDYEGIRQTTSNYLRLVMGCDVLLAGNMAEALRILEEHPETGFVVTDRHAPGKDEGINLKRELARRGIKIPVILTSSDLTSDDIHRFVTEEGFVCVLRKPVSLELLASAISNAISH